jgi:hypothetical protein
LFIFSITDRNGSCIDSALWSKLQDAGPSYDSDASEEGADDGDDLSVR